MISQYQGASIECLNAEIISRKAVPTGFINVNTVGRCIKYSCTRNASGLILSELSPKMPRHCATSRLDRGEKLSSDSLFFYANTIKMIKFTHVGGFTGSHGTQVCETNCYTYAEISVAFPGLKDPKQVLPPSAKLFEG